MKKAIVISIICLFFTVPATSNAGTLMLGAKSWYTWWDSAASNFGAREAGNVLETLLTDLELDFSNVKSNPKNGEGILYGPMLSYQTDDSLWSFSLGFMLFGSFSQDTNAFVNVEGEDYLWKYDLDLDRKEIDFGVSRLIRKNLKVFLGVKYQEVKYIQEVKGASLSWDFDAESDEDTFQLEIDREGKFDLYEAEATILMPAAGIGYVYPLSDKIAIGFQGGLLLVTGKIGFGLFEDSIEGWEDFDTTLGFNGECSLTYMINRNLIMQVGYRYQTMKLKADFGSVPLLGNRIELDDIDTVHGFTVSAVYAFDL